MVKNSKLIIAAVILILAAIFFSLGWRHTKRAWDAYPQHIIVDTPEDFQQRNAP